MPRQHTYETRVVWTGDRGAGTADYRAYGREHEITAAGPPPLPGTADPAFRGERERWNPEQLLLAALSQCHMLSYLALCSSAGVVVTAYTDDAVATMAEDVRAGGRFTEAVLRPRVEIASERAAEKARELHARAHEKCFIANSVNFPVRHEPEISVREA